jgi:hypothetical protein
MLRQTLGLRDDRLEGAADSNTVESSTSGINLHSMDLRSQHRTSGMLYAVSTSWYITVEALRILLYVGADLGTGD